MPFTEVSGGTVYGLIAFLLVAGWRERRPLSLIAALIVGVLYGGTLLSGVLPTAGKSISPGMPRGITKGNMT